MSLIVRDLPFSDRSRSMVVGEDIVTIKPYQIVLWLSLADMEPRLPSALDRQIPVIFDTGFNGNLLIHDDQLINWARLRPSQLTQLGKDVVWGQPAQTRAARIWLYANVPGQNEVARNVPPTRLEVSGGIIILPAQRSSQPAARRARLPLLGMRAFGSAGLRVVIDYELRRVAIGKKRRFWPFGS